MPKLEKALSPKQERFVLEYLVDFNATRAAITAARRKEQAWKGAKKK